jgi:homoserine O-acetyltransferase
MTEKGSVGIVETKYFTFAHPPNEMVLESGAKLGPIQIAYETYGTLNEEKSNAVLILHALSGDAHAAGYHTANDSKPGWWDLMIGPGKAFDTDRYFIICSNVLGGCRGTTGPSSLNPATGKPYGLDFPVITIGDMVRAQRELIRHLGIEKLLAVAGGSMGGMQALEWATRFPDMVRSAIVIAATAVSNAQQIAFDAVGRQAIMADPYFRKGQFYGGEVPRKGLAIARMLAHITYLSDELMHAKFGRNLRAAERLRYDFDSEFAVETYLDHQGEQFVNRFDANSYLYITKAMDYFDLPSVYGSLDKAMSLVKARMLVISFTSDWLYPPYQSQDIVYALARQKKEVTYCNIKSDCGHDAFLLECPTQERLIRGFLEHVSDPTAILRGGEEDTPPANEENSVEEAIPVSIYRDKRIDYDTIINLIEPHSRVLDIGCGDGELLRRLAIEREVQGLGMEISERKIVACVERGVSVIQADIDEGLSELPDQSFDYAVLSMTLQVVKDPLFVLREMLRVSKRAIVSFPNFGYWRVRAKLLVAGRAPVTRNLPYNWYDSPNRHVLSIKDFRNFCKQLNARIDREIPLYRKGELRFLPNVFAEEALYVISRS